LLHELRSDREASRVITEISKGNLLMMFKLKPGDRMGRDKEGHL
jgi:hypothetical protein